MFQSTHSLNLTAEQKVVAVNWYMRIRNVYLYLSFCECAYVRKSLPKMRIVVSKFEIRPKSKTHGYVKEQKKSKNI